jgi:hypothetical protein
MPGVWINRVQHVNDGEAVNGAIDSRPTRGLEGNTHYLKDRIDSAELGEGVIAHGETVEPGALVGMAVYRNSVTAQYERAMAAVVSDPTTGTLVTTPSSDCVGIIIFKSNATKADILLAGRQLVDISQAVTVGSSPNSAPPGRYYLSSETPGMLVQQRPAVSCSVLVYTDDGYAVVQPIQRDFLEDHIHYKVRLYAQPAGINVIASGADGALHHSVGVADATKLGWLPANHAIFNNLAPTGAAFGYNLSTHPALSRIFPPIPPDSAVIFLDRGEDTTGGKLVPMGEGGLCVVDHFGIWWMSDCVDDAPWPANWAPSVPPPTSGPDPPWLIDNAATGPECPRLLEFEIILAYTVMVFTTERTVVTSLQPAKNSPLTFTDCYEGGLPAKTGDLFAGIDLAFLVDPGMNPGSVVLKTLDPDTGHFQQGPVTEGLIAGSSCTLTSLNGITGTLPKSTTTVYQGLVQIDVNTQAGELELPADLLRLDQTQERFYLEVPYIGFDANYDTSIRMRFFVPTTGLPAHPTVAIRMQVLGRASGTLPSLSLSYRILERPSQPAQPAPPAPPVLWAPPSSPVILPGLIDELPLNLNGTGLGIGVDQYTEVQSDPIPVPSTGGNAVNAGDTILVTLTRIGTKDGYSGEIGIMRPVGVLINVQPAQASTTAVKAKRK